MMVSCDIRHHLQAKMKRAIKTGRRLTHRTPSPFPPVQSSLQTKQVTRAHWGCLQAMKFRRRGESHTSK
jgi:hypothetical protein